MIIKRKIENYDLKIQNLKKIDNVDFLSFPFYITLPDAEKITEEKELLKINGALCIRIIKRSFNDNISNIGSLKSEGCFYFNPENERILEVEFTMHRADMQHKDTYFLRLPLSAPVVESGGLALYFDGTWMRFMKNGFVLNENSGLDLFVPDNKDIFIDDSIKDACAGKVVGKNITFKSVEEKNNSCYISPYWWNAYAGDVMNYYHNGVYHLLYLLDRRHHGSRNGCGAHSIAHITSSDLINWEEQENIVSLEKPWMTVGTGTMFFHEGKYYMSYGLHTERYTDKLGYAEYNQDKDCWNEVSFETILANGKYPAGATYAVSDDGIHFEQSKKLYHSGRNPSVYADENGELTLYSGYGANGVWRSDGLGKTFSKSNKSFDFATGSLMRNSTECPSFFEWNGYNYLIIGFTGYFRTGKNDNNYFDAAAIGEEIYDGLCVPMVTTYGNNRKLISGWINGTGWGSVIVHRELIQNEDGSLGMKWVPEMIPKQCRENLISKIDLNDNIFNFLENISDYLFDIQIESNNDEKIGLCFSDDNGCGCEIQIDFKKQRLQFNENSADGFSKPLRTIKEVMEQIDPEIKSYRQVNVGEVPNNSRNFCISGIADINEKLNIRIICSYIKKLNSTVLDVEINKRRTAISLRKDLKFKLFSIKKYSNALVKNNGIFNFK